MKHCTRKTLTKTERDQVKNKYGGNCANCQAEFEDGQWESDHINPLWKGSEDTVKTKNRYAYLVMMPSLSTKGCTKVLARRSKAHSTRMCSNAF